MDRPEWIAVNDKTREVVVTLTNNTDRGAKDQPGPRRGESARQQPARPDRALARSQRRPDGDDLSLGRCWRWPAIPPPTDPAWRGNFQGDAFANPDGVRFDPSGRLWVMTDVSPTRLNKGEFQRFGNNQMLVVDPATGAFRRFLTGPVGCEITGLDFTPDGRTAFLNIQHPGEIGGESNDPKEPQQVLELAGLSARRPAALGHGRDSQGRWRLDRKLGRGFPRCAVATRRARGGNWNEPPLQKPAAMPQASSVLPNSRAASFSSGRSRRSSSATVTRDACVLMFIAATTLPARSRTGTAIERSPSSSSWSTIAWSVRTTCASSCANAIRRDHRPAGVRDELDAARSSASSSAGGKKASSTRPIDVQYAGSRVPIPRSTDMIRRVVDERAT